MTRQTYRWLWHATKVGIDQVRPRPIVLIQRSRPSRVGALVGSKTTKSMPSTEIDPSHTTSRWALFIHFLFLSSTNYCLAWTMIPEEYTISLIWHSSQYLQHPLGTVFVEVYLVSLPFVSLFFYFCCFLLFPIHAHEHFSDRDVHVSLLNFSTGSWLRGWVGAVLCLCHWSNYSHGGDIKRSLEIKV